MSEKKVISIRFCTENKQDMQLYERLEQEAGTSALNNLPKKVHRSTEKCRKDVNH